MFLKKLRNIIRAKVLLLFKPISYIKFFSKKSSFNFIVKKLRNIYYEGLAKHDLMPIQKVKKVFERNDTSINLFIDTHDFSNVGQVIDPDWEAQLFNYYKKINKDKILFVDIGWNIGCHSLFFFNYIKFEKIIYIEPNDKCYELFKKSLSIQNQNRINDVLALNKAISDKPGTSSLKFFKNNSGSGSLVDYFGKKEKSETMHQFKSQFNFIDSENITFPEIFQGTSNEHNIIIKMDIQGYEPKMLLNLSNSIHKYNISHCFFELNQKDQNIIVAAIKKFDEKYVLKDLNDKIIKLEDINKYLKQIILLEKIN